MHNEKKEENREKDERKRGIYCTVGRKKGKKEGNNTGRKA